MTQKGFTLIELLVVVLILGIIAAIAIPRIADSGEMAKINVCRTNVKLINEQIEKFKIDTGEWPNNLNELTENPDYFPDGLPECPFGNSYPISGSNNRTKEHNH